MQDAIRLMIPGVAHSPPISLFSLNDELANNFIVSDILSSGIDIQKLQLLLIDAEININEKN